MNPYQLLTWWNRLKGWPMGKRLFSLLFGLTVPYTGTICPNVLELDRGFAKIQVSDRRRLRNHLRSIHAIALANLAEATSGLAFISSLAPESRAILVKFEIEYQVKARGKLVSQCRTDILTSNAEQRCPLEVTITDSQNRVVASARATWLVRPA